MTADRAHGPWAFDDPRTLTHPDHAVCDDATAAVLEEATVALTLLRAPMQLGDGLARLHALTSLRAQIQACLPVVVAGARDQGHRWNDIAAQLGMTSDAARRRYRAHINTTNDTR